jgi:hypothetical protein
MRRTLFFIAASLTLAGCGEGSSFDTSFKKSYRDKGIQSCVQQARQRSPIGAANVDIEGLCACTIDKVMEGKSATDLMGAPDEQKAVEAIASCTKKMGIPTRAGADGKSR